MWGHFSTLKFDLPPLPLENKVTFTTLLHDRISIIY